MAIFKKNTSRWILPLTLLCFSPYNAVGQPGSADGSGGGSETQAAVVIAVAAFFFVAFYSLTCWFRRCRDHGIVPPATPDIEGGGAASSSPGFDTVTIESFPSFRYEEVKGLRLGNGELQCAVCLNEFEDDETLRLMTPCGHVFHAHCIDPWLFSHSTCPFCRRVVAPEPCEVFPRHAGDSDTSLGDEEMRDLESSDRNLIERVTSRNNKNWSLGSEPDELSAWSGNGTLFSRSRSIGHSMVPSEENLDRFTLRLPEEVRIRLRRTSTEKWTRSHAYATLSDDIGNKTNLYSPTKDRTITGVGFDPKAKAKE